MGSEYALLIGKDLAMAGVSLFSVGSRDFPQHTCRSMLLYFHGKWRSVSPDSLILENKQIEQKY